MTKARDIADLGSNDVLNTTASGVDVTGTLVADGVTVSNSAPILTITDTDGPYTSKVSSVGSNMELHAVSGNMRFRTGSGAIENMRIAPSGDITMYKDDGSTAGFEYDASTANVTVNGDIKLTETGDTTQSLTFQQVGGASFIKPKSGSNDGELYISGGQTATNRMKVTTGGDIIFYQDDGTTQGLKFDASSGHVGIGASNVSNFPAANLHVHKDAEDDPDTDGLVNFGDEASVIISTNAVAAGGQGYIGSLWFGSQDIGATDQYLWKAAGIVSDSGTHDTGTANASGDLQFYTSSNAAAASERMRIERGGNIIFNEDGNDQDFRVESDTNSHAFFLNAGANRIGLFESNPQQGVTLGGGNIFEYRTGSQAMFRPSGNDNDHRIVALSNLGMDVVWGGAPTTSMQRWRNGQEVVFNEDSVDQDFRVESDNMTHALFVQGYDGKVGVFNAGPRSTLEVGSTNAKHGLQLNGGPNGVATQIHMIDGKAGSFTTLTIDVQLAGAGGYFYQVQVAGTGGCRFQTGGGYTNGTNNFSHSVATGSSFTVTSPSSNLIRLVCTSGVGTHPGCEIKMTHALSADHDQDNVTITWS